MKVLRKFNKTKTRKRGPNKKSQEISRALDALTFMADNVSVYLRTLREKSVMEISALERAMNQMDQTDTILADINAKRQEQKANKNVSDVFGNG